MSLQKNPTYTTWRGMKDRCNTSRKNSFYLYKNRGISVCEKWKTFEGFLEDMGERPEGTSIDRIDNDKGYYKENCKWSTRSEQSKNRRPYTNTGEKYISKIKGRYWTNLPNTKIYRFNTLEEAVLKRDELLSKGDI